MLESRSKAQKTRTRT